MSSTTRFGLSLFLLIATIGCGKIVVSPVRDTDTFESFGGGVFYALPMTMITLEIPVTKIERKVVHFPDSTLLASSPLGHNNPDALITTYDLGDIAISSRPVPDAEKIFNVAIKGNWKKTQALQLSMNDLGILSKAEAEVEDHTFDIVIQAAQSIAGITQALVSFKGSDPAKMTKDSCQISKYKAELRQIREARFSLLKSDGNLGYGHMPEGALRLRLDELKRQEENLISLMTYAETKTKLLIRKDILIRNPEDIANLSENPVFWFDKSSGLMLPEDEKPPVGSNL
ncbi:DUF4831 family protein [Siphonobacter aquaeclarae]|uniref:DUF4831 family protein n=1 Tax=Siphonobacter aquaeclarae TaxID=563176 RepID=UPI000B8416C1|nr:DUF4831 family protein [Siphonobacter aquaeclarae]